MDKTQAFRNDFQFFYNASHLRQSCVSYFQAWCTCTEPHIHAEDKISNAQTPAYTKTGRHDTCGSVL